MTRKDTNSDSFVSRRKTLRAGLIGGLSVVGLATPAAADEQSAEQKGHEHSAEQKGHEHSAEQKDHEHSAEQKDHEHSAEQKDHEQSADGETAAEGGGTAQIAIPNQDTAGGSVVVSNVVLPDGGFISIHDQRRYDGKVAGSIIGITPYLEPGQHSNVSVPFFTANATAPGPGPGQDASGLVEDQELIAIPHRDGNGSGQFEGSDPAYKNGPSTLSQFGAVNDVATVRVTEQ